MKLRNESGRSMIEMTAVISIIGILSIASFFGYRTAMVRIRTNTLLSEANRRAVSISSQLNQAQIPTLAEFKNNTISGGIEFDTEINTNSYDGQFGIKVSNVSYKICNNLLDATKQSNSPLRAIASEDAPHVALTECPKGEGENAENEEHNYMLIYNNDLATTAYVQTCSQPLIEITMCDKVTKQKCCPDNGPCKNQETCCTNDPNNPNECDKYGQVGQSCQGTVCRCPEGEFYGTSVNDGTQKKCWQCDNTVAILTTRQECGWCGATRTFEGGTCMLNKCGDNEFRSSQTKSCITCSNTTNSVLAEKEECQKCDDTQYPRYYNENTQRCYRTCKADEFRNKDGNCQSCSSSADYEVLNAEECNKCNATKPTRYMVPNSNICRKECETGYYRDGSGNCLSCTEESASGVTTSQENCAKCAADGDQYARSFVNGKCYRCPSNKPLLVGTTCTACPSSSATSTTDATSCARCSGGKYYNGKCIPCASNSVLNLTSEECGQCGTLRDYDTNLTAASKCKLKNCPSSDYFRGTVGTCYACSNATAVEVTSASDCTNACSTRNTYTSGSGSSAKIYCYLGACAPNYFKDTSKNCRICSNATSYSVSKTSDCTDACTGNEVNNVQTTARIIVTSSDTATTYYCALGTCATGYFRTNIGTCTACASTTTTGSAVKVVDAQGHTYVDRKSTNRATCESSCADFSQRKTAASGNNYYCIPDPDAEPVFTNKSGLKVACSTNITTDSILQVSSKAACENYCTNRAAEIKSSKYYCRKKTTS